MSFYHISFHRPSPSPSLAFHYVLTCCPKVSAVAVDPSKHRLLLQPSSKGLVVSFPHRDRPFSPPDPFPEIYHLVVFQSWEHKNWLSPFVSDFSQQTRYRKEFPGRGSFWQIAHFHRGRNRHWLAIFAEKSRIFWPQGRDSRDFGALS